ncbi:MULTISPECIES: hypothetical protein [unclassified Pseudoclavibacter]|uniref:hypothetical protein n=1 Tax=unclassified Pseudoclavibacter TaxID=2615177 RepID=UPI001BAA3A56|nr:hypothetical protein [Pseudoclavibacter sp. Marseille-Q4354]MBS3177217.1 hypothetical protein [Pseudoclavibacter sp. Marseille-Q4354]
MSHRYESNVRDYLQRATPREWAAMQDREQTVVSLASQIREMVEQTENQLLGQTSSNPDYLQEVGRRNQAKRTAEEIAFDQILHEAYPAEEADENEPEPITGPLWSNSDELPPNFRSMPSLEGIDARLRELPQTWTELTTMKVVLEMDGSNSPSWADVPGREMNTGDLGHAMHFLREERIVVAFLLSLDWPQWRAIRPSLERVVAEQLQQPLWDLPWESFFAIMRDELRAGNPQRILQEQLLPQ